MTAPPLTIYPAAARRRKPNRLPWLIAAALVVFSGLMLVAMLTLVGLLALTQPRLPAGITAAGIAVGGQTLDQAAPVVEAAFEAQPITLTDGDRSWTLSPAELGLSLDTDATLASAAAGAALLPRYTINLTQTQTALAALSQQVNLAPTTSQAGRAIEVPVVLDRLRFDASGELADGLLDLSMMEVEPLPPDTGPAYSGATTIHIVQPGQELGLIAKEYNVSVADIAALNGISNPDLLYVGQELTIPAAGRFVPTAADAPPAPTSAGKAIVVSVSTQRIYAYENGQFIRSHLVSTGRTATPTVLGDFSIYVKYAADDMSGPGYFLPQVPYTMYFYRGYAIHGTYWHNSFGRPMSHGCVNLPVDEAAWWFNWAEVGTPVRVVS